MGAVAEYIYASAIRPVKEMVLVASIGMIAGICSRSYSISGTGLNQYLVLLGGTGTGKEGMASGIESLYRGVAKEVPSVYEYSGPSSFSSGQALMKHMTVQPCFLTIFAEFGLLMQTMSGTAAPAHMIRYRQSLLTLYTKSGPNAIVNASVYAKKDDSSEMVESPNLTILGESTPEAFYQALSEDLISEGLIPRFQIIEYNGDRVAKNPNAFQAPGKELIKSLSSLVVTANSTANNKTNCRVRTTPEALVVLDKFDRYSDHLINGKDSNQVLKQLWNRAHLKALRLAAIVAVGQDIHNPTIDESTAKWAIRLVSNGINIVLSKFVKGEVGGGSMRHESDVRKAYTAYTSLPESKLTGAYAVPKCLIGEPVVPYGYLRRRLRGLSSFKEGPRRPDENVRAALDDLCQADILIMIDKRQAYDKYKIRSPIYTKGPSW